MATEKKKTIAISKELHEELSALGKKGETYDQIVKRLLKEIMKKDDN